MNSVKFGEPYHLYNHGNPEPSFLQYVFQYIRFLVYTFFSINGERRCRDLTAETYAGLRVSLGDPVRSRESPDYKPYKCKYGCCAATEPKFVRVVKAIVVRKSAGVSPRVGSNPTRPTRGKDSRCALHPLSLPATAQMNA